MTSCPEEIAKKICELAFDDPEEKTIEECTEALCQLKAIAENPYNSDYYRVFYRVLEAL